MFLKFSGSTVGAPVAAPEVRRSLEEGLGLSRQRFGPSLGVALDALAAGGGWRLSLSDDPADAMAALDARLEEVAARG